MASGPVRSQTLFPLTIHLLTLPDVTGSSDAKVGILVLMDIFGFFPQTLQGADILAHSDAKHQYRVFLPDMFDGEPADISWYPPVTEEQQKKMGEWWGKQADVNVGKEKVLKALGKLKEENPDIEKWIAVGYCWGGKVTALTSGENSPWTASVQCHPAMVASDDAKAIKIPTAMLASKDEDAAEVKKFEENLKANNTPHYFETFDTQIHGWMAARSDHDDPKVLKEYERGYKAVLEFLAKHVRV